MSQNARTIQGPATPIVKPPQGHTAAIPEPSVGQVYRHPSTDDADIEIASRLRDFGYAQVGMVPIPLPVVGRVWIGRMEVPLAGTVEILCTAEGLAARGYVLTDTTEGPSND